MKKIFQDIKKFISSFIDDDETDEQKTIIRHNRLVFGLIAFIILYCGFWMINLEHKTEVPPLQIVKIEQASNIIHPTLLYTNTGTMTYPIDIGNEEFKIGEIVGIKYFGTIGLIIAKSSSDQNSFNVMYKDNGHVIQVQTFKKWLLYHPQKDTLTPLSLQD